MEPGREPSEEQEPLLASAQDRVLALVSGLALGSELAWEDLGGSPVGGQSTVAVAPVHTSVRVSAQGLAPDRVLVLGSGPDRGPKAAWGDLQVGDAGRRRPKQS